MSRAASPFGERWARDHLARQPSEDELKILNLFPSACDGNEAEAANRARRYYEARGPGGLAELWHNRRPDDEAILSSCQDAYIIPLRTRSVAGRRITVVRMPAPTALDRPLSAKALLTRWLMILDIRLKEDPTPGEEILFVDVCDLQPSHVKSHLRGSYWKDFNNLMKMTYPIRLFEVHVVNTQRIKIIPLIFLQIGISLFRRKIVRVHSGPIELNQAMDLDYFPIEGLPYEYGGKAGAMRDLNGGNASVTPQELQMSMGNGVTYLTSDEWTKKILSNSKWLISEERKFYTTILKPDLNDKKLRRKSAIKSIKNNSYDLKRSLSTKSLKDMKLEDSTYGVYRNLTIVVDYNI